MERPINYHLLRSTHIISIVNNGITITVNKGDVKNFVAKQGLAICSHRQANMGMSVHAKYAVMEACEHFINSINTLSCDDNVFNNHGVKKLCIVYSRQFWCTSFMKLEWL